jgi:DNA-binding NarL/FixJ family response regulator
MRQAIRVLVADDHPMVRECISKILESQEDFQVVGKASNGVVALEMTHTLHPDVVLMDYTMPLMDGVEATRHIRKDHPEISVIGLSVHEGGQIEKAMRKAGATTYCQKGCPTDELLFAIRECSGSDS